MNILKKILWGSDKSGDSSGEKKLNIEKLIASNDVNNSIIEIDNFVYELCSWGDDIEKLTEQQKFFYYNQNLEREVNNGGFNLYFLNSSGEFAHETINALKTIKAEKTANILQKAIDVFPDQTVPRDRDKRREVVEAIKETASDIWDELDQSFFAYEDDLNSLNIEYVKQYQERF